VRLLLIFLVVFGNISVGLMATNPMLQNIVKFIFCFHIPLFAFVSGYFSKPFMYGNQKLKAMYRLFAQYLLFQGIYLLADHTFFHTTGVKFSLFEPYWMLWFLFSMIFWRLLLIVFDKSKYVLMWSFLLGLLIGLSHGDGTWMSLSRTFIYFPYVVLGYYFDPKWLETLIHSRMKLMSIAYLSLLFVFISIVPVSIEFNWFIGNATFNQLHVSPLLGVFFRFLFYIIQVTASVSVIVLVSTKPSIFSRWGERTIYVYLLHGIIIRTLMHYKLLEHMNIGAIFILAVFITFLLVQPIFRLLRPIIEPHPILWLRKIHDQCMEHIPSYWKNWHANSNLQSNKDTRSF
jgi:fucose 4-O-acetylase-like acetyltransferase